MSAIAALESALKVTVPPALRRYFEAQGSAKFLTGTDIAVSSLAERTRDAADILYENGLKLEDDAIVIAAHQGYDFTWIRASLGDASPVFGYIEGDAEVQTRFASIAEWVAWAMAQP
jgi:hypothetical protein